MDSVVEPQFRAQPRGSWLHRANQRIGTNVKDWVIPTLRDHTRGAVPPCGHATTAVRGCHTLKCLAQPAPMSAPPDWGGTNQSSRCGTTNYAIRRLRQSLGSFIHRRWWDFYPNGTDGPSPRTRTSFLSSPENSPINKSIEKQSKARPETGPFRDINSIVYNLVRRCDESVISSRVESN